jgi:hypothetical protein
MIQVICAVIAAGIAVFTQRANLSATIDIETILKILFAPTVAVLLFQLGKYVERRSAAPPPKDPITSPFDYQFITSTIKVGSYQDLNEKIDRRRVSIISIKEDVSPSNPSGAEVEVTGTGVYFSGGNKTTMVSDKRFILPANSRRMKTENFSMFEFVYREDYLTLTAISVDHINIPSQEVTLDVCSVTYNKSP